MKDYDPAGKLGPKLRLPDVVIIHEPKEEEPIVPQHEVEETTDIPQYQPEIPAEMTTQYTEEVME